MSVCIVIQSSGIGGGGSDATPGALNWTDITSFTGTGQTNAQTISGTDKPIQIDASFTLSGSVTITVTAIVNGANIAAITAVSADLLRFYAPVGASIVFEVRVNGLGSSAASGTFTVVNATDANTTLDTFAYYVER